MTRLIYAISGVALLVGFTFGFYRLFFGNQNTQPIMMEFPQSKARPAAEKDTSSDKKVGMPLDSSKKKASVRKKSPITDQLQKPLDAKTRALLEDARKLITDEQIGQAAEMLKDALASDPENSDILAELGFIYGSLYDQPKQALQYLQKALTADANHGQASFEMVSLMLRQDQNGSSESFLRDHLSRNPNSPVASMMAGDYYSRKGNPEEAIANLNNAIAHPETRTQALFQKAQVYRDTGDAGSASITYREIANDFEKLIEEDRSNGRDTFMNEKRLERVNLDRVSALIQGGKAREARKLLETINAESEDYRAMESDIEALESRGR